MSERKQGRRSAEEAEHTKCEIMRVAGEMFAEHGFEGVSLRNISEKAGVSHSLIRHHFGSKEKIWQAVSDAMDSFMQNYITQLMGEIPSDRGSALRVYHFLVRISAFTLLVPQPIQFIADAIRVTNDELLNYFLRSKDEFAAVFENLFNEYNHDHPENPMQMWELKWLMLQSAHAAISMRPMLGETWPEHRGELDTLLLKHWQLFNQHMAMLLRIPQEEMLQPKRLEELMLEMPCCPSEASALSQSAAQ